MAIMEVRRAEHVCYTCKLRKKTCDKALPACSFCAKRGWPCRYNYELRKDSSKANWHNLSLDAVKPLPPTAITQYELDTTPLQDAPSIQASLEEFATDSSQSIDPSVAQKVESIIALYDRTVDGVIQYYFEVFHTWCPVVAPDLFRQMALDYRMEVPPADFCVLLLAMCLVTTPPAVQSSRTPSCRESLYAATKSLFMQTQATICASLRLTQAALLITAYEYVRSHIRASYVSLGTCTSMARAIGIKEVALPLDESQGGTISHLKQLERSNIWWAVVMLERIVLCEMDQPDLLPSIAYPAPDAPLPSELTIQRSSDECYENATSQGIYNSTACSFGRQAQSLFFLDRILNITRSSTSLPNMLSQLKEVDRSTQAFLTQIIEEDREKATVTCAATALTVRSLFMTHEVILKQVSSPRSESDHRLRQESLAALSTACQIVVDVSNFYVKGNMKSKPLSMPIYCSYNVRKTMQYLRELEQNGNQLATRDIETLLELEKRVCKGWIVWEPEQEYPLR